MIYLNTLADNTRLARPWRIVPQVIYFKRGANKVCVTEDQEDPNAPLLEMGSVCWARNKTMQDGGILVFFNDEPDLDSGMHNIKPAKHCTIAVWKNNTCWVFDPLLEDGEDKEHELENLKDVKGIPRVQEYMRLMKRKFKTARCFIGGGGGRGDGQELAAAWLWRGLRIYAGPQGRPRPKGREPDPTEWGKTEVRWREVKLTK